MERILATNGRKQISKGNITLEYDRSGHSRFPRSFPSFLPPNAPSFPVTLYLPDRLCDPTDDICWRGTPFEAVTDCTVFRLFPN